MAFNVQSFKSQMVNGGARPSLFDVEIRLPSAISGQVVGAEEKIRFMARATQIPPMIVDQVEVPYFGRRIKFAGDRTFPDWNVTIINDEDFLVRKAFEAWSNALNSIVANATSIRPGTGQKDLLGYKTTAVVKQYSKGGVSGDNSVPITSYNFVGIFPTTVDPIQLDWDSTNQIETFGVTFAYDWWEPDNNTVYDINNPGTGYKE